jgi:hypothetical protein
MALDPPTYAPLFQGLSTVHGRGVVHRRDAARPSCKALRIYRLLLKLRKS